MKIAITSLYLPSGSKIGVGYQVHDLANHLVARGHDVTVFSQTGPGDDSRYAVQVVPSGRRLRTFQFAWNLRGVDFAGFDVLNAHGDDWFLWGTKRPRHVHTFHGSCLAEMWHARRWAYRARHGLLAACEFEVCYLADELVGVSENTRRYIPQIRHVIPCGVDTAAFGTGDKSAAPSILFVGTMLGRKRGRLLLDHFQRVVRPRVPGARLWCVCEEKVESPGVEWFGRVDFETLTDLYKRAWAFCLPSTYEGFGVPYIEAMASGTPVVATPNPGSREVLGDGKWGRICDDARLGDTLADLLLDDDARADLSRVGLERSRDFSWDVVCEQYERLYRGEVKAVAS